MTDLKTTVLNERLKLLATFTNGIGIAVFAVGGIAPTVTTFASQNEVTGNIILVTSVCTFAAFALHLMASSVLKRMK